MATSMSEPKTSVRRLQAVDKQQEALELRKAGKTFEYIAEKLGYATKSGAHKAVMSALQRTLREPADELRALENERLDTLHDATWGAATRGIPQAVDRVLRIMERRAKYFGLDAPTKIAPTSPDGTREWLAGMGDSDIDRAIIAIVDRARARAVSPADAGASLPLDNTGAP